MGGTQKQMRRTLSSLALGGDAGTFFFQILKVSVLEEEEEEEEEEEVVVVEEEGGGEEILAQILKVSVLV